jgi:hypothetical protein
MSKSQLKATPNTTKSQHKLGDQGVGSLTGLTLAEAIADNAKWRLEKTIAQTKYSTTH